VAVDAVLIERPRSPLTVPGVAVMGIRAAASRELTVTSANPTGAGDRATVSWRWWHNRPRIAASYAAPLSVGGVLGAEVFRDQQTYGALRTRETRKGGAVTFSDWATAGFRWSVGFGVDQWTGRGRTVAFEGLAEQRWLEDRVALTGSGTLLAGSFSAWAAASRLEWRSRVRHEGHVVLARTGIEMTSDEAPLALWPGAGLGHARGTVLRAHPLLDDGVIDGEIFGRTVSSGGVEWRRWMHPLKGTIRIAPALFVDAARAGHRLAVGDAWHVDAGGGVRIAIPGSQVLRIDFAKGLRDSRTVLSVGWTR
jgi:hypothetical protein